MRRVTPAVTERRRTVADIDPLIATLTAERHARRYARAWVAEAAQISPSALAGYEDGSHQPPIGAVRALCGVYGWTLAAIVVPTETGEARG